MDRAGMSVSHDDTPEKEKVTVVVGDYNAIPEDEFNNIVSGKSDPFSRKLEKIKKLDGMSATAKRRLSRSIKKANEYSRGEGDSGTKQKYEEYTTGYAFYDLVSPQFNLDYLAKLYEISAAHHAAVNAKVVNTVGLGYEWRETLKTEEIVSDLTGEKLARARRKIDRARKALVRWLENLNSEDTFEEVLWKVCTDLEVLGNGYIEIGRKSSGEIGYMGHIPATTIRRRSKRDGYVQIVANRVTFFRNFGDTDTSNPIGDDNNPNEIIHFMKYTPTDTYYGIPDIVSARNSVAGSEFAEKFNLDYFEHKAVPRYIVTLKGAEMDTLSEQRIIQFLSTGLKGNHHRTLYVPLPGDDPDGSKVEFKMEAIEAGVQDASFSKYIEFNRDMIFMAHRVPISQTGINANVSLGAVRDATRMFKEQVIRPMQKIWEKKLAIVFKEKTDIFYFKLTELTLTDEETMSKVHERYLRWGVEVPNEVRQDISKKPRKGGDSPVGMMEQMKARTPAKSVTDNQTTGRQSRTRDAERSGGPDDSQSAQSRNPKGEGRQQA
jgi:PBSX family phage portal protein